MTLRSISAKAAWILRKARPVGAAMVEFVDQGDEFTGPAAGTVEVQDDNGVALGKVIETDRRTKKATEESRLTTAGGYVVAGFIIAFN